MKVFKFFFLFFFMLIEDFVDFIVFRVLKGKVVEFGIGF